MWSRWDSNPRTSELFLNQVFLLFISKKVQLFKSHTLICDPVGIQTQDLQNFFSTRSFCSLNSKGEPTSDSPYYYVIPLGFKPKTFRTGIWRSIQLSYGTFAPAYSWVSECKGTKSVSNQRPIYCFFYFVELLSIGRGLDWPRIGRCPFLPLRWANRFIIFFSIL